MDKIKYFYDEAIGLILAIYNLIVAPIWDFTVKYPTQSSAIVALYSAYVLVTYNRITSQRKNSIDLVTNLSSDPTFNESFEILQKIIAREDREKIISELGRKNIKNKKFFFEKRRLIKWQGDICILLNTYEDIAIGILCGIYDEEIIKRSIYTSFTHTYKALSPMIKITRIEFERPTLWQEYENLVKDWIENPLLPRCGRDKTNLKRILFPHLK